MFAAALRLAEKAGQGPDLAAVLFFAFLALLILGLIVAVAKR